jgi:hypothetical protein
VGRSHVYSNFFVGHPKPVQQMCGRRRSARPFGGQPPSKVAKIVKNCCFCGCLAGRCGQTGRPTGLGHISLDNMGNCPSLLFCTIFFPLIPWPGRLFKVAWVKNGPKPSKKVFFAVFPAAGHGRTGRPTGLTGTSLKLTGHAGFGDGKIFDPPPNEDFFSHSHSK